MALPAQNLWKPIGAPGYILAVGANGYLYSTSFEEGFLWRSTDEGLNWELVYYGSTIYSGTEMTVSEQGRLFLVPNYSDFVYYSDDDGDTWHSSARFPTCLVEGMYAVSNDTLLIWGASDYGYESLHFTLDGGATWNSADINPMGRPMGRETVSIAPILRIWCIGIGNWPLFPTSASRIWILTPKATW